MAVVYQLDLFKTHEESKFDAIVDLVNELKGSQDKVRKGMFARLGEHGKHIGDLQNRMALLERNICRGG